MRRKIGLQDGFPTAFAVKEPKDMDGLCSFIDLIKSQVALYRHKPDAKAGQKWVTDNGIAFGKSGELCQLLFGGIDKNIGSQWIFQSKVNIVE